jgi:hypothetical protein
MIKEVKKWENRIVCTEVVIITFRWFTYFIHVYEEGYLTLEVMCGGGGGREREKEKFWQFFGLFLACMYAVSGPLCYLCHLMLLIQSAQPMQFVKVVEAMQQRTVTVFIGFIFHLFNYVNFPFFNLLWLENFCCFVQLHAVSYE